MGSVWSAAGALLWGLAESAQFTLNCVVLFAPIRELICHLGIAHTLCKLALALFEHLAALVAHLANGSMIQ